MRRGAGESGKVVQEGGSEEEQECLMRGYSALFFSSSAVACLGHQGLSDSIYESCFRYVRIKTNIFSPNTFPVLVISSSHEVLCLRVSFSVKFCFSYLILYTSGHDTRRQEPFDFQ